MAAAVSEEPIVSPVEKFPGTGWGGGGVVHFHPGGDSVEATAGSAIGSTVVLLVSGIACQAARRTFRRTFLAATGRQPLRRRLSEPRA